MKGPHDLEPVPANARTPTFDAYLMVDWSGSSTPKSGADSIWYSLLARGNGGDLRLAALENPRTRDQATMEVRCILAEFVSRERRVLVGFDFPYGYPAGLALRLGLDGERPWRAVWELLAAARG